MMLKETLTKLKSLSNEKMFAQNIKNGAGKNQFGVKLGDIRVLANKIKTNHTLALELWKTGNIEARLAATLIVHPKKLSAQELDEMVKSIAFVQEADWFNAYVVKDHPQKESLREKWMSSANPWAARAGWSLTQWSGSTGAGSCPTIGSHRVRNAYCTPRGTMDHEHHSGTNWNQLPKHRKRAINIGESLGIYRDYPVSKGCTSPFAPIWIGEMVRRKG